MSNAYVHHSVVHHVCTSGQHVGCLSVTHTHGHTHGHTHRSETEGKTAAVLAEIEVRADVWGIFD